MNSNGRRVSRLRTKNTKLPTDNIVTERGTSRTVSICMKTELGSETARLVVYNRPTILSSCKTDLEIDSLLS